MVLVDQDGYDITEKSGLENGTLSQAEEAVHASKKLQGAQEKKSLVLKRHQDNIKFLKTQEYNLCDTILDMQERSDLSE